jgi:hypothetical protein
MHSAHTHQLTLYCFAKHHTLPSSTAYAYFHPPFHRHTAPPTSVSFLFVTGGRATLHLASIRLLQVGLSQTPTRRRPVHSPKQPPFNEPWPSAKCRTRSQPHIRVYAMASVTKCGDDGDPSQSVLHCQLFWPRTDRMASATPSFAS